jgi:hypothetical protein
MYISSVRNQNVSILFQFVGSTFIMQATHLKTKPMKHKIDFMNAKNLVFLSDTLESINFERVFGPIINSIREISKIIELFSTSKISS